MLRGIVDMIVLKQFGSIASRNSTVGAKALDEVIHQAEDHLVCR